MKNSIFIFSLLITSALHAQIGIKAGLTFNNNEGIFKSLESAYQQQGDNNIGYHVGVFKEFKLLGYFIEPEIQYVTYKSKYQPENGNSFNIDYQRIDVPISFGKYFAGLFKIQAGPVLSYNLEDDINWNQISNINQEDISIGLQIGAGFNLTKLSVDVRYDFPLSKRQTDFVKDKQFKFQTEQTLKLLHVSLGYKF